MFIVAQLCTCHVLVLLTIVICRYRDILRFIGVYRTSVCTGAIRRGVTEYI